MTWEPGKIYWCRDGKTKARIYALDCGGVYPIHGAVAEVDGGWDADGWRPDGTYEPNSDDSDFDLTDREVKEPRKKEFEATWVRRGLDIVPLVARSEDSLFLNEIEGLKTKVTVEEIIE